MQELDKYGRPYKCGPNWVPNWLYDEPAFRACCTQHDKDWTAGLSKWQADRKMFKCCLAVADSYTRTGERARAFAQAYVMYFILLTNPVSYVLYLWSKITRYYER